MHLIASRYNNPLEHFSQHYSLFGKCSANLRICNKIRVKNCKIRSFRTICHENRLSLTSDSF